MPRQKRILTDYYPYHVTTHLIDGLQFSASDLDLCIEVLVTTIDEFDIETIAYNFMHTHYHIILKTSDMNLDRAMHYFNGGISKKYNRLHNRKGHVWRRRYYPKLITTDEQLLICMRYVDRNPIVAGLVNDPSNWKWSSFKEYYFNNKNLISPPGVYNSLGPSFEERFIQYRDLVMTPIPSDNIPEAWRYK